MQGLAAMKYARLPLLGILIALLALEASAKCNKTLRIGINENTVASLYFSQGR